MLKQKKKGNHNFMELYELENENGEFSLEKLKNMNMPEEDLDGMIKTLVENCTPFFILPHYSFSFSRLGGTSWTSRSNWGLEMAVASTDWLGHQYPIQPINYRKDVLMHLTLMQFISDWLLGSRQGIC